MSADALVGAAASVAAFVPALLQWRFGDKPLGSFVTIWGAAVLSIFLFTAVVGLQGVPWAIWGFTLGSVAIVGLFVVIAADNAVVEDQAPGLKD